MTNHKFILSTLISLLLGKPVQSREAIFGQFDLHNIGLAYMRMILTKQFKYVKHSRAKYMDELFDLESDPNETKNLIKRRSLPKWQKSIRDPILEPAYQ